MKLIKRVAIVLAGLFTACSGETKMELPEHIAGIENLTVYELPENPPQNIDFILEMSFGDSDDIIIGRIAGVAADENG